MLWSILQCSELSQTVKKENSYLVIVSNYLAGYPAKYPTPARPLNHGKNGNGKNGNGKLGNGKLGNGKKGNR